ncbi:MAG: tryptophan--tRNA ligase [Candidatus Paceibacterota bacterium]|jgi:tryptophanyl-tRNA synthetase
MKKILLSGVKPTGRPHIGNYFGAMKQFVDLQNDYKSFVFLANYHALTGVQDAKSLGDDTLGLAIDYLAIGLNPKNVTLFLQSDVPEVTELAWIFNCITTMPYLMRAHAFKDALSKSARITYSSMPSEYTVDTAVRTQGIEAMREVNVGTFDYPLLMAADILIQDADVVPVGADQKQHVEYARDTAEKFNRIFGDTFKLPEPLILPEVKTVIGTDGRKMSKSYGNTIELFASDQDIRSGVMSIPTDSKGVNEPKNPDECNVFALHKLFSAEDLSELKKRYIDGGIGYKESKDILVENMIRFVSPLRENRTLIEKNPDDVKKILRDGGEIARERARLKMIEIRKKVGLTI